jgi:hypothetical protein
MIYIDRVNYLFSDEDIFIPDNTIQLDISVYEISMYGVDENNELVNSQDHSSGIIHSLMDVRSI